MCADCPGVYIDELQRYVIMLLYADNVAFLLGTKLIMLTGSLKF